MNKEKVIIVGVHLEDDYDFVNAMEELHNLCDACNYEVVHSIFQNLKKTIGSTYFGEGKALEIKQIAADMQIQKLVVNDDLTPAQTRNLEKITECKIIDRSGLILEIFASRAKTKEAKLQVEIATLKYKLPRLVVSDAGLSQQRSGAGVQNKGSGEKQIDVNRSNIRFKITELQEQLKVIATERANRRRKRQHSEIPTVAIVGYTNAGKSTLMNYMVRKFSKYEEKEVFEKDMLFATLDTSVRKIILDDKKAFLLSDTVGFISKLPHDLIKAFRSTLEEAKEADLLLHVVDISNPNHMMQEMVTLETLADLDIDPKSLITVLNKSDKLNEPLQDEQPNRLYISSKTGAGFTALLEIIKERIFSDYATYKMFIPYSEIKHFSHLNEIALVKEVDEQQDGILFVIECSQAVHAKYCHYDVRSH